jgi:acetylglutamate kinase
MPLPSSPTKTEILAATLPYLQRYHGKTLVIKYGGNAMTEKRLQHSFARDVALLKLIGIHPVIVHGGGPQIDQALQKIGQTGRFVQGMRVTDAQTLQVVGWVLAGEVQQEIVALINQYGGCAVGLTGRDGGLVQACPLRVPDPEKPGQALDIGQVGEVADIRPALVKTLQENGFIPVISPLACDASGQSYNINADLVAGKLAAALDAEKLIMMTNITGVLDKQGNLLAELSTTEIDTLCADGTLSGGMLPKISAALDAAKSGVRSVHIIDGRIEHALLLEMAGEPESGTVIRAD